MAFTISAIARTWTSLQEDNACTYHISIYVLAA